MKGIVFTEFLEMVEDRFGFEAVDRLVTASGSDNDGVYTAVGTYDHMELIRMVVELAKVSDTPVPALVGVFGKHLFGRFVELYPTFFKDVTDCFSFLERIEGTIHTEVLKLYPDAELPKIDASVSDDRMTLLYTSPRCLSDLAEGLILGCAAYFQESLSIAKQDRSEGTGRTVEFILERSHAA